MAAEETNFLEMEDDEFEENYHTDDLETEEPQEIEADKEEDVLEDTDDDNESEEAETEDDIPADSNDSDDESDTESHETEDDISDTEEADTETLEDDVDYKALYDGLMAPLKANGKEFIPGSVDDQRSLMQKGLNYELKMKGIKPIRTVQKTLEDAKLISNGTIDTTRLNFLMDINKGDKGAILALLKESEIDPMELDMDSDEQFVPNNHIPDEQTISFEEVVNELSDNPNFEQMINTINEDWDTNSRTHFYENPNILKLMQHDVDNGSFERITGIIENERAYGRLNDVSTFDAYVTVAKALNAQDGQPDEVSEEVVDQAPVTSSRENSRSKKRAAGSVRSKPAGNKGSFNPLTMSDEEFEAAYPD